jgi:hypothetical protein
MNRKQLRGVDAFRGECNWGALALEQRDSRLCCDLMRKLVTLLLGRKCWTIITCPRGLVDVSKYLDPHKQFPAHVASCEQYVQVAPTFPLLRLNMLELLRLMHKVVGICLWRKPPFIWLLDKIFISLFLGESNRVLFCLEVKVCPLHVVGR